MPIIPPVKTQNKNQKSSYYSYFNFYSKYFKNMQGIIPKIPPPSIDKIIFIIIALIERLPCMFLQKQE